MSEIEPATPGDVVYSGMATTPGGYLGGELENNSIANLNIHGGSTTTITTIVTQSEGKIRKKDRKDTGGDTDDSNSNSSDGGSDVSEMYNNENVNIENINDGDGMFVNGPGSPQRDVYSVYSPRKEFGSPQSHITMGSGGYDSPAHSHGHAYGDGHIHMMNVNSNNNNNNNNNSYGINNGIDNGRHINGQLSLASIGSNNNINNINSLPLNCVPLLTLVNQSSSNGNYNYNHSYNMSMNSNINNYNIPNLSDQIVSSTQESQEI